MPKIARKWVTQLAEAVLDLGAKKATKFVSPTFTIKATEQGRPRKNAPRKTLLFTFGRPNYAERLFIKACKESGEPFPVKKLQVQWRKP